MIWLLVGTDDGEDDIEQSSVGGKQDGQNVGRKLSAKTIKAILELICDEAVSSALLSKYGNYEFNVKIWDLPRHRELAWKSETEMDKLEITQKIVHHKDFRIYDFEGGFLGTNPHL